MGKKQKAGKEEKARVIELLEEKARRNSAKGAGPDTPLDLSKPVKGVTNDNFAGRDATRQPFRAVMPDGTIEEHWLPCPPDEKRCIGNVSNGPYAGQRCRRPALLGARVCLSHGGQLPAVRQAAQRRLLAAQDLAVRGVLAIAFEKSDVEYATRLRAMQMLMDRGGLDAKQTIEVQLRPFEKVMQDAMFGKGKKSKKGKKRKGAEPETDLGEVVGTETFDHWVEAPEENDE
jgi:hypothetical protein